MITPTIYPGIDVGIAVPDMDYFSFSGQAGEIALLRTPTRALPGVTGTNGVRSGGHNDEVVQLQRSQLPAAPDRHVLRARAHSVRCCPEQIRTVQGAARHQRNAVPPCGYGGAISLYDGWGHAYDQGYSADVNGGWYGEAADYSIIEADGRQFVSCRSRSAA